MADRAQWTGRASDLLQAGTNRSGWPKSARALAGRLRRAQTFLRTLGIETVFGREGRLGTRTITISREISLLFPIWEHCYEACMRLIARNVLLTYARTHPETAVPLERWYRLVKAANWTSMDDIRRASPKAKVLNRDRARFEVAGGNYRLIASFDFRRQIVFVKFIGTHAEYDAIDALTVASF